MNAAPEATQKPATASIRIAKDLADKAVIVAQARDTSSADVLDAIIRAPLEAAYFEACKTLTSKASPPDLGGEG